LNESETLTARARRSTIVTFALIAAALAFLIRGGEKLSAPEISPMGRPDQNHAARPMGAPGPGVPVVSEAVSPDEGYFAPDFDALDLQGHPIKLSALRGKAVFLNFWATWCGPCKKEMPAIGRLIEHLPPGAAIVTVASDSQEESVHRFVRAFRMRAPVIMDADGALGAKFRITGIPTTFLIDSHGIVVKRIVGPRAWDDPKFSSWFGALASAGR
jgi:thiol-disulfide isomerase/thioredoxin